MKNWRTTLIGCLLAAIVAVEPIISEGEVNWIKVGFAAMIAMFSVVSKDANVTGLPK